MGTIENNYRLDEGTGTEQFIPGTTFRNGRERGLEDNEIMLGFKAKDLEGKTILELGSGENEVLSRELKEAGVTANIICLNPDFIYNSDYRKQINELSAVYPELEGKSVGAIAQHLPFKDESFDEILVNHSLSVFVSPWDNLEGAKLWAREVARVLKKGGNCRICPVTAKFFEKDHYNDLFEIWDSMGVNHFVKDVSTVDLLGDYIISLDSDGLKHKEKIDPSRVLYQTLILEK